MAGVDWSKVAAALATGEHTVEQIAAWVENAATIKDVTKLGVSVYQAMRRLGIDPIFGSKQLSDAAIEGAELSGDLAEDVAFPPGASPKK